ncbi:hypothetical protein HHI36_006043 [Cryptolaemus montrouzieri]|uniref:Uncharacterized protein n=1 Tax=Cryptolaemus montrouzieri TaxID=559131 RepID=A0ABD2NW49_9CUCU
MYFAFVRSKLDYSNIVYGSATESRLQTLETINNNAGRLILAYIRNRFDEHISNHFANSTNIYTDGSVQNGKPGCAIRIPVLNYSDYKRLHDDYSVISAEDFAIYLALQFIKHERFAKHCYLLRLVILSKLYRSIIYFCPCGIIGIEEADSAAKDAVNMDLPDEVPIDE